MGGAVDDNAASSARGLSSLTQNGRKLHIARRSLRGLIVGNCSTGRTTDRRVESGSPPANIRGFSAYTDLTTCIVGAIAAPNREPAQLTEANSARDTAH